MTNLDALRDDLDAKLEQCVAYPRDVPDAKLEQGREATTSTRALDTAAAAHYIGMSEGYLESARSNGGAEVNAPPHLKIGKRVLYLRDDLDAWLEHCRDATNARGVT